MSQTVEKWRSCLIDQKTIERSVTKSSNQKVVSQAFAKWVSGCLKHLDQQTLMECHRKVKAEGKDLLRRCLYKERKI